MRVSEKMKMSTLIFDLNRSMRGILDKQIDLATSKRIHQPSDDPSGTSKLLRVKNDLRKNNGYEKNIEDGLIWLSATETALSSGSELLNEASSIMMQAASDTTGEEEREILAGKMRGILDQLLALANSEYADNYIFGGTNTEQRPYTVTSAVTDEEIVADLHNPVYLNNIGIMDGSVQITSLDGSIVFTEGVDYTVEYEDGTIRFLDTGSMVEGETYGVDYATTKESIITQNPDGVGGDKVREIDRNVTVQINVHGDTVFGGDSGLLSVIKNAMMVLERNDKDEIDAVRDDIATVQHDILQIQGEVGIKISRFEKQIDYLGTERLNLEEVISSIEDTDVTSTLLQLERDQIVYQTALRAASQLMQMTLLDFL